MVSVPLYLLLTFIVLFLFDIDVTPLFLSFSSILFATTFMFSSSLSALVESIVLLFLQHPFDVGDQVVMDGRVVTVRKIQLWCTEVRENDGRITSIPNRSLWNKEITNLRRTVNLVSAAVSLAPKLIARFTRRVVCSTVAIVVVHNSQR